MKEIKEWLTRLTEQIQEEDWTWFDDTYSFAEDPEDQEYRARAEKRRKQEESDNGIFIE